MEFTTCNFTWESPNERFWLFDLDEHEYYFRSLNVIMNDSANEDLVRGFLHLNSRSIIFDPYNEALPLIKIRFNSHFEFEWMPSEKIESLSDIFNISKSVKSKFEAMPTSHSRKSVDGKNSKLSPSKKEPSAKVNKITLHPSQDCILFNVYEAYIHPRRPRGPFAIHKYNSSFVFVVNETQEKWKSFCKVMKYLWGEKNPDIKAQHYIEQLLKSEGEEIVNAKEAAEDTILMKHRASRIMIDGNQIGYFVIWNQPATSKTVGHLNYYIEFISLVNDSDSGCISTKSLKSSKLSCTSNR